jgi:superoxide reductase
MIEKKQVYKCDVCGNVVESLWNGTPDIVCCGKPMTKMVANTVDAAKEKHVPVIERKGDTVTVKVGSAAHPMEPKHYILFVELVSGDDVYRHDFKEGDTAALATFKIDPTVPMSARAYCNLHGLWAAS